MKSRHYNTSHSPVSTFNRLLQLALRLGAGRPVTTAYIVATYNVSPATAKRDMTRLECAVPVAVERGESNATVLRVDRRARFTAPRHREASVYA